MSATLEIVQHTCTTNVDYPLDVTSYNMEWSRWFERFKTLLRFGYLYDAV